MGDTHTPMFLPFVPQTNPMDTTTDTCQACGATLKGVERKRGTCHGCKQDGVTK